MNILSNFFYKFFGVIFIVAGLLALGYSGYLYQKPYLAVDFSKVKDEAMQACIQQGKSMDFNTVPNMKSGDIQMVSNGLEGWDRVLANASVAIKSCPEFKMTEFCMGAKCKDSNDRPIYGITFNVKYQEPNKN
jgi:hypothetical protein